MAEVFDFGLQQHKIKMDGKFFENNLFAVAGDTGRRLEVQLLDTNGMVQNTTGLNLRLNALVAGKATFTDATLVDAATGKYQLDLSNGMFLAPGNWQFQWQIIDSAGKKLHSFAFTGNVGSNISEGGSQATNFYLNLEDLKAMQEDLVNGTIDSAVLETNITEKLTNLETQYAPKLTEVTAQLAQTVDKINHQTEEPEPLVTVIFDDGRIEDYSLMFPFFKARNIVASTAILTKQTNNHPKFLDTEKINEMKAYGWEFMSHTVNHLDLSALTKEEQEYELGESKKKLEELGLDIEGVVYPYNYYNAETLEIARKHYDYAFAIDAMNIKRINHTPINQYAIYRISLESDVSYNKPYYDDAIKNNGWIVFMAHGMYYDGTEREDAADMLAKAKANIDYLHGLGIRFATAKDAIKQFGNAITIGDDVLSDNNFYLSNSGEFSSKTMVSNKQKSVGVTINTQVSDFELGSVTNSVITDNQNGAFPEGKGGALITNRLSNFNYNYQIWMPRISNNIYKRLVNPNTGEWLEFSNLSATTTTLSIVDISTLIGDFELGKISYSTLGDSLASGLPEQTGGTLMTNRLGRDVYNYQMWFPRNSNNIYKRLWNVSSGNWSSFRIVTSVMLKGDASLITSQTSMKEFAEGSVTVVGFSSAYVTGFPENDAGNLTVNRTSSNDNVNYQKWIPIYTNNEYVRYWNAALLTWKEWIVPITA